MSLECNILYLKQNNLQILTHIIVLGLPSPFSHLEAFSASSFLPWFINQIGDSVEKNIPMIATSGTTQQKYARKCQTKYVPIK
jgi:hypothetical protein